MVSILHQPERLSSFERKLRALWQEARLGGISLRLGDGRFQILKLLGHGASAVVCEAMDAKWRRRVAIKLFPREIEDRGFGSVQDEACSLRALIHTNIVTVDDFDQSIIYPGDLLCHWLSMELIAGRSLRAWLGHQPDVPEVLAMLRQVGEGLWFAHDKGVQHRDLKPENVMITTDGVPKLVDFGLAVDTDMATDLRGAVGTPPFMAPEALRGEPNVHSDQFSFAATLWLGLCRDFPYDAASHDPRARGPHRPPRDGVSAALVQCMRRALDPDPARRFPTMRALLDALDVANREPVGPTALALARPRERSSAPVVMRRPSPAPQPEIVDVEVLERSSTQRSRAGGSSWPWVGVAALGVAGVTSTFYATGWFGGDEVAADIVDEDVADARPLALPEPGPAPPLVTTPPSSSPSSSQPERTGLPPLAPPPVCAIPAAVGGRWRFATAVESASRDDLKKRRGRYELTLGLDTRNCSVAATFSKIGNDLEDLQPPLTDKGTLEFSVVPSFTGRLVGTFTPHVPWAKGAYTYDVAFILDGDDLYGSFRARGDSPFAGLLRGSRVKKGRKSPASGRIRERQPCRAQCDLHCPRDGCEARCASGDAWAHPTCPTP